MEKLNIKTIILYILTFLVVVIGDQLSKILVSSTMILGQSVTIIEDFFYYTYSHNQGAAWGILSGHTELFIVIALVALAAMVYYFTRTKSYEKLTRFGLVLTFSGAVGNIIDRICLGYVRDFIDFIILGYDFPVFNIADMAVVIGVGLIIVEIIFEEYIYGNKKTGSE
ncbi:MAG: signal peptidase II [Faecalibacillus sp.]